MSAPRWDLQVDYCKAEVILERFYVAETGREFMEPFPSNQCWLCERASPVITFRKDAHVLPQAIGNKAWLTRDECDECNERSGRFESALVASLAPYRFSSGASKGRPKFKHPQTGAFIMSVDSSGQVFVSEPAETGGVAELLPDGNMLVRVPVDGYRPMFICRALARLALVAFPEERARYQHVREWLREERRFGAQALVTAETKGGMVFTPCLRVYARERAGGRDLAVALTYGGALYWFSLPRGSGDVTSTFIDLPTFESLLSLSWKAERLEEDDFIAAHAATLTLVREPM